VDQPGFQEALARLAAGGEPPRLYDSLRGVRFGLLEHWLEL
jgi:hypothetical protein